MVGKLSAEAGTMVRLTEDKSGKATEELEWDELSSDSDDEAAEGQESAANSGGSSPASIDSLRTEDGHYELDDKKRRAVFVADEEPDSDEEATSTRVKHFHKDMDAEEIAEREKIHNLLAKQLQHDRRNRWVNPDKAARRREKRERKWLRRVNQLRTGVYAERQRQREARRRELKAKRRDDRYREARRRDYEELKQQEEEKEERELEEKALESQLEEKEEVPPDTEWHIHEYGVNDTND